MKRGARMVSPGWGASPDISPGHPRCLQVRLCSQSLAAWFASKLDWVTRPDEISELARTLLLGLALQQAMNQVTRRSCAVQQFRDGGRYGHIDAKLRRLAHDFLGRMNALGNMAELRKNGGQRFPQCQLKADAAVSRQVRCGRQHQIARACEPDKGLAAPPQTHPQSRNFRQTARDNGRSRRST